MIASFFFSAYPSSTSLQSSSSLISVSLRYQNPTKAPEEGPFINGNKHLISADPISRSDGAIKIPTAPWMKGPLLLHPNEILHSRKPDRLSTAKDQEKSDRALTGKESGVRGKKAMKKIIQNVEKLKEGRDMEETREGNNENFEFDDCLGQIEGADGENDFGGKMPWSREHDRVVFRRMKKEKVVTVAELALDKDVLERLRGEATKMRKWVKVKKAGVTQAVVDQIMLIWRSNELAMVKFDVPLCRNMDRAREIIEMKTGGLVVWSRKDVHVIYRGSNDQLTSKMPKDGQSHFAGGSSLKLSQFSLTNELKFSKGNSDSTIPDENIFREDVNDESVASMDFMGENKTTQPVNGSLYERETDRLLEGLGPRYIDWWMRKPLPVDADLLPEVVTGFAPPLRRCSPHTRAKLTDDELTYLRKLAHPLPFHFVLGRNRRLQGLAAAILKLWEKSLIAKIAVKWGIPNTNNEEMANELKDLTGGVLILRNKFLIILFRGKDFMPCGVADLVLERERVLRGYQLFEEGARLNAVETFEVADEPVVKTSSTGTLSEFQKIQTKFGDLEKGKMEFDQQLAAEKEILEREWRKHERKLFILKSKIEESEKELNKLNSAWEPSEMDADQEILTEEERECFRKIGLKMNSSLVLGRRGIFDGVIEGLHQHWKHREVVKVITMQHAFSKVLFTAQSLAAESGGVLVSVDKLKEGHAIIIYRGKNYRRPSKVMTENLLTKREALERSLEMQRLGSLKSFAYQKQRAISDLKLKLA